MPANRRSNRLASFQAPRSQRQASASTIAASTFFRRADADTGIQVQVQSPISRYEPESEAELAPTGGTLGGSASGYIRRARSKASHKARRCLWPSTTRNLRNPTVRPTPSHGFSFDMRLHRGSTLTRTARPACGRPGTARRPGRPTTQHAAGRGRPTPGDTASRRRTRSTGWTSPGPGAPRPWS